MNNAKAIVAAIHLIEGWHGAPCPTEREAVLNTLKRSDAVASKWTAGGMLRDSTTTGDALRFVSFAGAELAASIHGGEVFTLTKIEGLPQRWAVKRVEYKRVRNNA